MGKFFSIPLKLNFTSNTLGCYGLMHRFKICHRWSYQVIRPSYVWGRDLSKWFKKYILKIIVFLWHSWYFVEGLSGDNFRFDPNGDGPARYNIIHFKQVRPGDWRWLRVGEYRDGQLMLNMSGKSGMSCDLVTKPFLIAASLLGNARSNKNCLSRSSSTSSIIYIERKVTV